MKSLQKFESGQVYEVVFKNIQGDFLSFHQSKKNNTQKHSRINQMMNQDEEYPKFLIYIVNQQVKINDEPQTLTFFKDITFGVLYE